MDEETWLTVQKIRETKHRPTKKGDINPLTGLVYCADCGAKMFNHRTGGYEKRDKDGNPTESTPMHRTITPAPPTVRQRASLKTDAHSIMSARMLSGILLLEVIKATSTYVMEHESEFIEKVRSATELQQESEAKALKKTSFQRAETYQRIKYPH